MKEYEMENEDDRPIHQRIFSKPEEPCIMPLPPEDLKEPSSSAADETDHVPDTLPEKKPNETEPIASEETVSSESGEEPETKEQ